VLGFVVALSLSFRTSTAYERYTEGRKYWTQLAAISQAFARLIWIHAHEREDTSVADLIDKASFCDLLVAFSVALKHRLRFEPFSHYEDLYPSIKHLPIVAHQAEMLQWEEPSGIRVLGWILGLPMADSNPRKLAKESKQPVGNIPLEILGYCSTYVQSIIENGQLKTTIYQTQAMSFLLQMNEILCGTERVLNTPLPVAYSIAIYQIAYGYIILLPFQLTDVLGLLTIPAAVFAAYVILGFASIGSEIENPFGDGVNDLPLSDFCKQIRMDVDIILSQSPTHSTQNIGGLGKSFSHSVTNPAYHSMLTMTAKDIRTAFRAKVETPLEQPSDTGETVTSA
jgi:predicted membrane chloride channel (bestrophin family)